MVGESPVRTADATARQGVERIVASLRWPTLLRCFLRTYLVGANFNPRGLQNMGLAYAMDPGLRALYENGRMLRRARKRYLHHYNTHPWWTPLLVGCFLHLEQRLEAGGLTPQNIISIRQTVTYTLSAIGDSFFGGSLLVGWALGAVVFLMQGMYAAAVLWLAGSLILLQVFKIWLFWVGVSQGMGFLQRLKRWNLINWGRRVKIGNALLALGIVWQVFPVALPEWAIVLWAGMLTVLAGLAARSRVWREIWIIGLCVVALVGMLGV